MRLQRFALEKEAEKRIALVRQQLRHANAQIDEYEQRYSMFEEVIDTLSNIEKELQEGMGSEDRTRFIKKQLIQVRKRIVPYVEEV
jgi:prefoldin subunit 5